MKFVIKFNLRRPFLTFARINLQVRDALQDYGLDNQYCNWVFNNIILYDSHYVAYYKS